MGQRGFSRRATHEEKIKKQILQLRTALVQLRCQKGAGSSRSVAPKTGVLLLVTKLRMVKNSIVPRRNSEPEVYQ